MPHRYFHLWKNWTFCSRDTWEEITNEPRFLSFKSFAPVLRNIQYIHYHWYHDWCEHGTASQSCQRAQHYLLGPQTRLHAKVRASATLRLPTQPPGGNRQQPQEQRYLDLHTVWTITPTPDAETNQTVEFAAGQRYVSQLNSSPWRAEHFCRDCFQCRTRPISHCWSETKSEFHVHAWQNAQPTNLVARSGPLCNMVRSRVRSLSSSECGPSWT